MARTEMVRFNCNYCNRSVDLPTNSNYPTGWMQFGARQTGPTEKEAAVVADLCPEHAEGFLDYMYGRNGEHRIKAAHVSDIPGETL